MKTPFDSFSKIKALRLPKAFTLTETVIAIGVLAVLLTGFIAVFTPAAQGIRRSISSEQADRLTTTLEMELATLRAKQPPTSVTTGFAKAFEWMKEGIGTDFKKAIFVYQYRGNPAKDINVDGMPDADSAINGEPGKDYVVQSIARRLDDPELVKDLAAVEGAVFFVRPTQLVFKAGQLEISTATTIQNTDTTPATSAADYKEAVIAFSASFYNVPSKSFAYLNGNDGFGKRFGDIIKPNSAIKPIFTRNLAVRR